MIRSWSRSGNWRMFGSAILCASAMSTATFAQRPHRAPLQMSQIQSPRMARVTCDALMSFPTGPLPPAWFAVSGFPLTELTSAEVSDLKAIISFCKRLAYSGHERAGIRRIDNNLFYIESAVRQREQATAAAAKSARDKAMLDEQIKSALLEIDTAVQQQARRGSTEPCDPEPREIAARISARIGDYTFDRQIAQSAKYTQFIALCEAQRRSLEAAQLKRREDEGRARGERRTQAIRDYIAKVREAQSKSIKALGLPDDLVDASLNAVTVGLDSFALMSYGVDPKDFTTGQWLALIMDAQPNIEIKAARAGLGKRWTISFKKPGQRTFALVVEPDGNDWFVTRLRLGDEEHFVGPNDIGAVANLLVAMAGLVDRFSAVIQDVN